MKDHIHQWQAIGVMYRNMCRFVCECGAWKSQHMEFYDEESKEILKFKSKSDR